MLMHDSYLKNPPTGAVDKLHYVPGLLRMWTFEFVAKSFVSLRLSTFLSPKFALTPNEVSFPFFPLFCISETECFLVKQLYANTSLIRNIMTFVEWCATFFVQSLLSSNYERVFCTIYQIKKEFVPIESKLWSMAIFQGNYPFTTHALKVSVHSMTPIFIIKWQIFWLRYTILSRIFERW